MTYTVRVLPDAEWGRLAEAGGPLAGLDLSGLAGGTIIVGEADGRIVAYWPILLAVHVEPLWIAPEHRGHAGLTRPLWQATQQQLRQQGIALAFGIVEDTQTEAYLRLVGKAGFQPVPGRLYFLRSEQPDV
jgi:hypothetical protein